MRRGAKLSDDTIYDGYSVKLAATLRGLQQQLAPGTNLLVRNCHAGRASHARSQQALQLERMNEIIARVAGEPSCVLPAPKNL